MSAHYPQHHEVIEKPSFEEWRSLRWLAARYESANVLLDCIDENTDEDLGTTYLTFDQAQRIANLCVEDGAGWGHIPCLGGRLMDYYQRTLGQACS